MSTTLRHHYWPWSRTAREPLNLWTSKSEANNSRCYFVVVVCTKSNSHPCCGSQTVLEWSDDDEEDAEVEVCAERSMAVCAHVTKLFMTKMTGADDRNAKPSSWVSHKIRRTTAEHHSSSSRTSSRRNGKAHARKQTRVRTVKCLWLLRY